MIETIKMTNKLAITYLNGLFLSSTVKIILLFLEIKMINFKFCENNTTFDNVPY